MLFDFLILKLFKEISVHADNTWRKRMLDTISTATDGWKYFATRQLKEEILQA
jgi:hypothetical protein